VAGNTKKTRKVTREGDDVGVVRRGESMPSTEWVVDPQDVKLQKTSMGRRNTQWKTKFQVWTTKKTFETLKSIPMISVKTTPG
jgi:hypothetical protein